MASVNQFMNNLQRQLVLFNRRISAFFSFIITKLKNFKSLTIQEQVSFGLMGIGLVFIVASIVLFLL
ncbi:hypothetical protein HY494_00210 [Candidatus Woesearchaeota archaeon]|nr:hypothetical protein [Candidatus Woesearchaeota archaeon]